MLLTASYSLVAASSQEEAAFLGWKHFIHELNTFLNTNVTKDTQGLEYVTLDQSADWGSSDQATLRVFIGESGPIEYDPEKLISGTKYFLGEHGLKIIDSELGEDSWDVTVSGLSLYERPDSYQNVKNTWMQKELERGTVIDIRQVGMEVEPGVFKINHYIPGTTYVDPEEEQFIFSIGQDKVSGDILGAYDTRFYNDDDYETLYLH